MSGKVLLASPRGYCAGVDRAVDAVERALAKHGAPVYVRKQIVHNLHVVRDLESKGAVFVDEEREVPEGAVVRIDDTRIRADAAVTINGLVRWTINHGAAGLEAWAGTPGTVGDVGLIRRLIRRMTSLRGRMRRQSRATAIMPSRDRLSCCSRVWNRRRWSQPSTARRAALLDQSPMEDLRQA